ncbi:MAG: transglycosylase SLT domain-containing protein [Pseudomonadota bacterium]
MFGIKRFANLQPHRAVVTIGALLLFSVLAPQPLHAESDASSSLQQQRERFLVAREALAAGESKRFAENTASLKDFPLYPYLVYWNLLDNLSEQENATVRAFIDKQSDTPLASRLRVAWLRHLAAEERWHDYLAFYRGSNSAELRCNAFRAKLHTGKKAEARAGAKQMWRVGYSRHEACDPLFAAWEKAGGLTDELRHERIELALEKGNFGLASYLARAMDERTQQRVALWRRVAEQPERLHDEKALQGDTKENRAIVLDAMVRLARRDAAAAAELWPGIAKRYDFIPSQHNRLKRTVAMNFAFDGDRRALVWFGKLPRSSLDGTTVGWAVRSALRQGDWRNTLRWMAKMPVDMRRSDQWRYWQARAYEGLDQNIEANAIYKRLSRSRSYYGFLAADRIGTDYNLTHENLQVSEPAVNRLMQNAAVQRARELYLLGMTREARSEWEYAVSRMNRNERLAAGKLADGWRWHDRALLTLAKANHFDDLNIRFPLAHHQTVTREAESHGLDPSWVYAVARQESAFIEDVRSSAGAMGLMQLMPGTGRTIARALDASLDIEALIEPETNIRFGSYYLQQVLNRFSNPVMATAAYNAGPHRVEKWKPKEGGIDADIWIDTMPFHETRQYVRRVMAYAVFYDQRLERPVVRLSQRMPRIDVQPAIIGCDDCSRAKDEEV